MLMELAPNFVPQLSWHGVDLELPARIVPPLFNHLPACAEVRCRGSESRGYDRDRSIACEQVLELRLVNCRPIVEPDRELVVLRHALERGAEELCAHRKAQASVNLVFEAGRYHQ
jgi:hypothetical protein